MIQRGTIYSILDDEFAQPIEGSGKWTRDEHSRFLVATELYPKGPWTKVADFVRTRSVRQILSHAQKYREKVARHRRGLKTKKVISRPQCIQHVLEHWSPIPFACTNPLVVDMVKVETEFDVQDELPTLPDSLDFLLDLLAAVDPIKIEGHSL